MLCKTWIVLSDEYSAMDIPNRATANETRSLHYTARLVLGISLQVIESLTPEESLLFQEKLSARAIQNTPGVCGGNARIRNTRIPV